MQIPTPRKVKYGIKNSNNHSKYTPVRTWCLQNESHWKHSILGETEGAPFLPLCTSSCVEVGCTDTKIEDSFQGLALSCLVSPETKLGLSDDPTELSLWSSIFISTFQQRKSCSTEKVTF